MAIVEHFEIPADDMDRAKAFYGMIFGWSMTDWDAENTMIDKPDAGGIGGDIHKRNVVPHPTVVISVDDIDATLALVEAHGGKRIGEIQTLTDTDRYAYFSDSEGNIVGLFDSTE
ncbi:putative enzyme related to lactoylglutathione lyase [Mycetocola sp. CAN_C7]|uniref:VOC family protein n=1 Tax=Mycetocola sp. CAN_C7 TaxID=2787724 RepID=UPI0018CAB6C3